MAGSGRHSARWVSRALSRSLASRGPSHTSSVTSLSRDETLEASPMFFHTRSGPRESLAAEQRTEPTAPPDLIPFPREGPGVNYALNWSLAAAGVTPSGEVSRNLKADKLATLGKGVKSTPGSKLLFQGDPSLPPPVFKRLLKEVVGHLSSKPSLYIHDGAVGSSSSSDARTRIISETPAAAAPLAAILTPTPTRDLAAASFPMTVYVVPSYKNDSLAKGGFIAADLKACHVVVAGPAAGDASGIKAVLSAAATQLVLSRGALLLPGRLVADKGSSFLLLAPTAAGEPVLAKASAWPEAGLIWSTSGVARLFGASKTAPNLYKLPSSLVLLTSDSTGALPAASKLTPQQAAFHFLSGYDGSSFHPALARSPFSLGAADPVAMASALETLISTSNIPAYLVNAHGQADVGKLASAVAAGDLPEAGSPPEDAVAKLHSTLLEYAKAKFPSLPEAFVP